jgi:hypothetical protein
VNVDGPRPSIIFIAPDVCEDVVSIEHAVWVADEKLEEAKFAPGEVDSDAFDQNRDPLEPDGQVTAMKLVDKNNGSVGHGDEDTIEM